MSANTGVILFQVTAAGVAGKVNGVVITSPLSRKAWQAVTIAMVPLLNSEILLASRTTEGLLELCVLWSGIGQPLGFPDIRQQPRIFFQRRKNRSGHINWLLEWLPGTLVIARPFPKAQEL